MFSFSKFEHHTKKVYFNHEVPVSKEFRVIVNGIEVPVYSCRISKESFNRGWPGYQRAINQTVEASYVNLVSDEELCVEVITDTKYERAFVKPYSKEIKTQAGGGKITFTIKENGQYILELDSHCHCLYIFNNKPYVCEEPEKVTHYFGAGIHFPGKIALKDNDVVYIDKDAYVYGCLLLDNVHNVRVYGNGIMDNSGEERFDGPVVELMNGNLRMYHSQNVVIEGVAFQNSPFWCVAIFGCFDVVFDDIKIFGQWRYNTDGLDICNSQRITVKNSFIQSFDDTIVFKGMDRYWDEEQTVYYPAIDNKDILVENCVFWSDWGRVIEFGFETACREYKDIIVRNIDVVKGCHAIISFHNGESAEMHDILVEDIRVEYESFYNAPQLQRDDDDVYTCQDEPMIPNLFDISDDRYKKYWGELGALNPHPKIDLSGIEYASVHDIVVRNIKVYYDEKIPKNQGRYNVPIVIDKTIPEIKTYNILLENIIVNGTKLSSQNAVLVNTYMAKDFKIV